MKENPKKQVKKDAYYDIIFRTYYKEALFSIVLILSVTVFSYWLFYKISFSSLASLIIAVATFAFFFVISYKSLVFFLDINKKSIETKRITIKHCELDKRWYDWYGKQNVYVKSFTELLFLKDKRVRRYKLYYGPQGSDDYVRLLLSKKCDNKLSTYFWHLDYITKNEKVKRSKKHSTNGTHELIIDVKYYKHSKIVCEIKAVQGSEHEKEDSEFLRNILRLN